MAGITAAATAVADTTVSLERADDRGAPERGVVEAWHMAC